MESARKHSRPDRELARGAEKRELQKLRQFVQNVVFPLVLLLFPLVKARQGIDLADTGYSLGNYRFFGQVGGVWTFLTFLANGAGYLLTKLPMGDTMLGMKAYTSLLAGGMGILGYRFFKTKMPAWLAFAGEVAAISFCWCPTVILYNYLTYLLFLLGAVLLFRGLAGSRPACLVLAGAALGLNALVRFPGNVLEAALIVGVWYYGSLKGKTGRQVARETGLCMGGYFAAFFGVLGIMGASYGAGVFGEMIEGVLGISRSASDYTFGEMLLAILDAYFHGFQWMLYMLLCILPGIPFLVIRQERFLALRKVLYCLCIPVLFFVLGKWGMYNFRYYQKEAALQWGAVFLLLALGTGVWMLFTGMLDDEWRLIGCICLVVLLVTPLGSNNHIWPVLNNLFFVAPVVFWMVFRFVRWGRTYLDATRKVPLFPVKAMAAGVLAAFFVQAVGIGFGYVFLDGETGEKREYKVAANPVLRGMYTSEMNAETLDEISYFITEHKAEYEHKKLILYGNIPGLSYYLDKPPAIDTAWADLGSHPLSRLQEELAGITQALSGGGQERPLVIITPMLAAYLSGNEEAMDWWGVDREGCAGDGKLAALREFMESNAYRQVFVNEAFAVYE
ncbi:hypothetical protein IMSAGC019_00321 [Lachnospiraceae bacterium]|nr:hypothetical protein IMSAGC019_00321 [Lachnospiraceae bacterium]